MIKQSSFSLLLLLFLACHEKPKATAPITPQATTIQARALPHDTTATTIHVLVALCDNQYQGIVPVPAAIGNGQDADGNLYWGCGYGVRTYFKKSGNWSMLRRYAIDSLKLERVVFKHRRGKVFLVADAYNGRFIRQCTVDFLQSCAGQLKDTVQAGNVALGINGHAQLLAYIGHDGLMDFDLNETYNNTDGKVRDALMLACISKKYFAPHLSATNARPLLWTTGLMAPEAYTLHDALESYIKKESAEQTRTAAAKAYARYQKCGEAAAKRLLVTGY